MKIINENLDRENRSPLEIRVEEKLRTLSVEQILEILQKYNIKFKDEVLKEILKNGESKKDSIAMIPIFDIPLDELEKTLSDY